MPLTIFIGASSCNRLHCFSLTPPVLPKYLSRNIFITLLSKGIFFFSFCIHLRYLGSTPFVLNSHLTNPLFYPHIHRPSSYHSRSHLTIYFSVFLFPYFSLYVYVYYHSYSFRLKYNLCTYFNFILFCHFIHPTKHFTFPSHSTKLVSLYSCKTYL